MKKIVIGVVFLSLSFSARAAEMRIWEDKNGNRYEAEFVRELFDQMTLRCKDGTEVRIPVDDFSEHDQKYMRVMVPPKISVDVSRKMWPKPKPPETWGSSDTVMMVQGRVTIVKESKRIFTSRLNAELFMIAEEVDGDHYVLLSKTDSSFLLGDHNDGIHLFASEPVMTRKYEEYGPAGLRGEEYSGYLVVVSDAQGNVLDIKTDIPGGWIEAPEVIENLRDLWLRGAPSLRSRHFDRTGKKAQLTRPKAYTTGNR